MDVVVWNLDARYRPELEVELEIEPEPSPADERERERAKQIDDLFADAWFLADEELS
jgi:hypothetical protein